jgi:DNA-binding protein YbaB
MTDPPEPANQWTTLRTVPVLPACCWKHSPATEAISVEQVDLLAIDKMVEDLRKSFSDVKAAQDEIGRVTGTAWSEDHLIKVVVGPRGQLVDLKIDPRAVRRANTEALAATILTTARAAAEEASGRTRDLIERDMPDLRAALGRKMPSSATLTGLMFGHDADLLQATGEDADEHNA